MKDLLLPLLHLAVTAAKLCRPGGVRAVIAENLLLKQQLIVLRRSRQRAPNLRVGDRLLCGFGALFLSPGRIRKVAIGLRPSTLLTFHQARVRGKYRRLFSSSARPKKPGPKGPSESLIRAIVELKSRNPRFGCPRIARIISQTFGVDIDKNVVHRVLAKRYRPAPGGTGPSWLSFVGHTTDSLWSVDLWRCASIVLLWRCASIVLQSDWVLVVMDQFTRRLVGFGVHRGPVDAPSLCRMCNAAIHGRGAPRYLSTDHDPLFETHRWTANLRLLEIDEIKTVPHLPCPSATRRKKGLPGAWAVLFQRAVGSDPAGCASRRAHRVETAIAFRLHNALGTQNERYCVAINPTAHSLACLRIGVFVTADAARLAPGVGGSPFTGRVSHPLDGEQSFMTSPHRHSPLTSLAWSHRAPTPTNLRVGALGASFDLRNNATH